MQGNRKSGSCSDDETGECNGFLNELDVYRVLSDVFGTQEDLAKAIGTSKHNFSKWISPPVEGHDNHLVGPLEYIDKIDRQIRAELDIARDAGNLKQIERCEQALSVLGQYCAQRGKGVFILRSQAKAAIEKLEQALELMRQVLGTYIIVFFAG